MAVPLQGVPAERRILCVVLMHTFPLTKAVTSAHVANPSKSLKMCLYTIQTNPNLTPSG